jgi:hypothetical protein
VSRADNLTIFVCRLFRNLSASTSWNPQGLPRPVNRVALLLTLPFTLTIHFFFALFPPSIMVCYVFEINTNAIQAQMATVSSQIQISSQILRTLRPIYRTGVPLPTRCCVLYIFLTNLSTEYFKHAAHSLFFSSKCRLFHNATFLVHVSFTFYIQGVLKFKSKSPVPKG